MSSWNSELIVLAYTKFGERSIVLHTLSREWGRRGFLVRVGKGVSMALFLPLNIIEAEIVENPKSPLWTARKAVSAHPLGGIRSNIHKNTMTLFMSEVLFRTLHEGTFEEGLFEWCRSSILTLDSLEGNFANFHLRFLLELAVAMGFSPSAESIAPFAGGYLTQLRGFMDASFAESMLIPLSGGERTEIARSLLDYLQHHTEQSINVRSLKVLHELYR